MLIPFAFAAAASGTGAAAAPPKPHILMVLADDLGYYDTAIHNPNSPTPNIAAIASEGQILDRHYVFRYCSPTRRSMLTGRFPNHITTVQPDGNNMCSDFTPLAVDIMSEKLAGAGYQCHFVGKGHLGYETTDHLPINRGFLSHVGYLGGSEGYEYGGGDANATKGKHDLWHDRAPGIDVVPEMFYSANYYTKTAVGIITKHAAMHTATSTAKPLFLYLPYQNVHSPNTLPPAWETHTFPKFGNGEVDLHTYANMLNMLDSGMKNVTAALKSTGMWANTLLVFSADNGGIGKFGNNHPLRGHKHDPWEGGIRATAFISGGFVPPAMRGTHTGDKFVHIADWYATFCVLAGVDPSNVVVLDGKPREIDGVDVWPLLTGTNSTPPRRLTPTTEVSIVDVGTGEATEAWWKLVTLAGQSNYYDKYAKQTSGTDPCLTGCQKDPAQPGRTDPIVNGGCPVCNGTHPCLYDIRNDPSEKHNVASDPANAKTIAMLAAVLKQSNVDQYVSGRIPTADLAANYTAIDLKTYQGYYGPCYKRKTARDEL